MLGWLTERCLTLSIESVAVFFCFFFIFFVAFLPPSAVRMLGRDTTPPLRCDRYWTLQLWQDKISFCFEYMLVDLAKERKRERKRKTYLYKKKERKKEKYIFIYIQNKTRVWGTYNRTVLICQYLGFSALPFPHFQPWMFLFGHFFQRYETSTWFLIINRDKCPTPTFK